MSEDEIGVDVVIENEEGSIDIQSDVLKGDKGDKGDPTATIEINQVLTGEAGTNASIENVGTDVNMKLNITIPKGDTGEPGKTPIKGTDYYTEEEKQELEKNILSQVNQFSVEVVLEVPTENINEHTIYFVPKTDAEKEDVYDEFIYINDGWEHIGTTEVDLSNYYNKAEIDGEIDTLNKLVGNKVDKIDGKDLSTNDFTDEYMTKLDVIEEGATNNTVEDSLESTSVSNALSANQGRILNEKITNATTYSTEEINTEEKWVDGKDIYRKVIYIGILPDDAKEKYAHNILNMDYLVQLNVTWYDTVDGKFWPLNRYDNAEAYIKFSCDKTNVQCETVYTWSDRTKDCYVILEYTKTTD